MIMFHFKRFCNSSVLSASARTFGRRLSRQFPEWSTFTERLNPRKRLRSRDVFRERVTCCGAVRDWAAA